MKFLMRCECLYETVKQREPHPETVNVDTSCMSVRLCSCIFVDPGRYIEPPPSPLDWIRDTVRRFWTLLQSPASGPFNCMLCLLVKYIIHVPIKLSQKRRIKTCLVINANFSTNSASPFVKGNRHPLPSKASIILLTCLWYQIYIIT